MTFNIFELDDTKLVEKFVQGSNQLLASTNLRLEVNAGVSQLLTRTGDVIAIMYLQSKPRSTIVKHNSPFLASIGQILLDRDFVLIGDASRAGFIEYRYYVTPAGYRIAYTDPAILWKKWWPTEKFQNKQRFNMDILLSFKDNWYPIQSINVSAGIFTIKTIAGQLTLKRDAKVLWLAQRHQETGSDSPNVLPDTSGNIWRDITPATLPRTVTNVATVTKNQDLLSGDLAKKIQEKQSKLDPERARSMISELEQKLQAQIKINQETEAKFKELENRANIAEQRLQIVYKFLEKSGIDRKDIYR
jgi:hypothetical protein